MEDMEYGVDSHWNTKMGRWKSYQDESNIIHSLAVEFIIRSIQK